MAGVEAIQTLTNQLSRLPGIGRKTAQRLAYHIVSMPEDEVRELAVAIFNGKKKVHFCPICGNLTDVDPCAICADPERRRDIVCVVRDARDVNALERMRDYNGLYHVLGGVISPMDGVGPDDIRIRELLSRLPHRRSENHQGIPAEGKVHHPYGGSHLLRHPGGRCAVGRLLPQFAGAGKDLRYPQHRLPGNFYGRVWLSAGCRHPNCGGYSDRLAAKPRRL